MPMLTEFAGQPVDGGTIPAELFASIIGAWDRLAAGRDAAKKAAGAEKEAAKEAEKNGNSTSTAPPGEEGTIESTAPADTEEEAPADSQKPAPRATPEGGGGGGSETDSGALGVN